MPILEIHLLGSFNLTYAHTHRLILDSARLQSLLVYLLLHRQSPQPRQHLAFLLWPDTSERQAQSNLRNLLHRLRTAFPDIDHFLSIESKTLQWRNDSAFTLDVADFEAALRLAEQSNDETSIETALARAVALYTGDLLPQYDDEWLAAERERLHALFLKAGEALITMYENQRAYAPAIETTHLLLRHEPLHERAYQRLMQLYALNGDRASALRTYHTCVAVLQRELAVEPDVATRQVYERLVNAEVAPAVAPKPTLTMTPPPFIGRRAEWRQLQVLWRSVAPGQVNLVVVAGEAGIGKTRLVEEWITWAQRQGFRNAIARCYALGGTLAYAPLVVWLRSAAVQQSLLRLNRLWLTELSRLLPELRISYPDLPQPSPMTESWHRLRLFEALAHAFLVSNQPLLLVIDDLQWCDSETLEWLHFLLRFDDTRHTRTSRTGDAPQPLHARLFIVGTRRTGELVEYTPLEMLLATLRRSAQLTELELPRLDITETVALAAHLGERPLDAAQTARLIQETEGNPLFVIEMMRAGMVNRAWDHKYGLVERPPFVKHQPLPATIQTVLTARLAPLSPSARDLVGLASVIGREFNFAVLAAASDWDEETLVQSLDELWQRRIVHEQGSDAYDFTHVLLREAAYMTLSAARRRLLHRRVAEGIARTAAQDLERASGQLALHFELGGTPQQAAVWYERAAVAAQKLYSNHEAMQFYQRALALIGPVANDETERTRYAQLHEGLGDLLLLTGQSVEARAAFERALHELPTEKLLERAALHQKIGEAWVAQQHNEQALQAYHLAETDLGEQPTPFNSAWWQAWVQLQHSKIAVYYWLNQPLAIAEIVEKIEPLVAEYGTKLQLAYFTHTLASLDWRRNRYRVSLETLKLCQSALEMSLQSGSISQITLMRFSVGFNQLWYGELDAAQEALQAALALAEQMGDVANQLSCQTYLTVICRKRGQLETVRELALHCLAVAETIQWSIYIGTASANLAWVAWHEGNLGESHRYGETALSLWRQDLSSQTSYPFQWTALWPLVAVMVAQDRISEALVYARRLLEPAQQALPDELAAMLEDALCIQQGEQWTTARSRLEQALALAHTLGYL